MVRRLEAIVGRKGKKRLCRDGAPTLLGSASGVRSRAARGFVARVVRQVVDDFARQRDGDRLRLETIISTVKEDGEQVARDLHATSRVISHAALPLYMISRTQRTLARARAWLIL